jgi:acetyl-CoA synthetase
MSDITIHLPSDAFAKQANVSGMTAYEALCKKAETDYEGFWAEQAREPVSYTHLRAHETG